MLEFLIKWQTYRTLKSGLLIDYYLKRLFFYLTNAAHKSLALFLTDKYLIEEISKCWAIFSLLAFRYGNQSQRGSVIFILSFYSTLICILVIGLGLQKVCTLVKFLVLKSIGICVVCPEPIYHNK